MAVKKTFIIGHKNPDTDSICSAIAYAELKKKVTGRPYEAKRAGQLNEETQFVLKKFGMDAPGYLPDVGTQVKDIEIRETKGIAHSISLKKAWNMMRDEQLNTLPVTDPDGYLEGLITIGDIATSYMDVYDSKVLSTARTPYRNIVETLDGTVIVGKENAYFTKGKVLIAAANPDLMESYIEEDDLVILGNRYESQLCAIEMKASCIIVCEGAAVSMTIQRLAEQKSCVVISTPHDTFTVARLINQSIPIKYFMKKTDLVTFKTDDYINAVRSVMAKLRHRDFPILNKRHKYAGMISRRNLLAMTKKQLILVDHNEKSQAVEGIDEAEILEIIDHHRIGSLETISPVYFRNQPVGCTGTIMFQIYREQQIEIEKPIAGLLCAAIISDTLSFRSPTCTEADKEAANFLAGIAEIDIPSFAKEMFHAGSNLKKKSPEEIFYQDFKKFSANGVNFGVGQINSMDTEELKLIQSRLEPYLKKAYSEHGVEMIFFMLTSIMDEKTELLFEGDGAKELVEEAFGIHAEGSIVTLEGVVSRKKQLIPAFMTALQQ